MGVVIDREFVRVAGGLVHLRSAGGANAATLPLYMAHGGPGSSAGLVPMIETLAASRHVFAPDMLGNGDSTPHAMAAPAIADYADDAAALLDALGIGCVDFYGQHTGAQIGLELALRHPARVRRLVLDGLGLYGDAFRAELLARYAPAVEPDAHGGHLVWAWNFVRELSLHFPHYLQDPAHRLHHHTVPPPALLHAEAVELLKALPNYHLAYRAAFSHAVAERLALLRHPTLLMAAEGDPLACYLDAVAAILRQGAPVCVSRLLRAQPVQDFLHA